MSSSVCPSALGGGLKLPASRQLRALSNTPTTWRTNRGSCSPTCIPSASYRASGYAPYGASPPLPTTHQLMGRLISLNPLETTARFMERTFRWLDLLLASQVDRDARLTWMALIGNGAAVASGLTLYQQLVSGQPAWLTNALEDWLGGGLVAVPQLLLLLLATPLALWHLRTWWAANAEVVRGMVGGDPFSATTTTFASWSAVLRLTALAAATGSALTPGAGASAAILWAASLLPLVAAAVLDPSGGARSSSSTSSSSSTDVLPAITRKAPGKVSDSLKQAAPMLLPLISSDAALLLASYAAVNHGSHAGIAAVVACGVKFAVALTAIAFQKRYKERLAPWQAAVGDAVEVHITVSTASGAAIDTTRGKRPLAFTVGQAAAPPESSGSLTQPDDAADAADEASSHSDAASGSSSAPPQPEEGGQAGGGGWGGEGGGSMSAAGSRGVLRFRSPGFAALLDELTPGLVVGERRTVTVHNPAPKDGGFLNPDLVWWQEVTDLQKKFKGELPQSGQVFWYPLGPGRNENWAPVRVNALNASYAELDGNADIEDAEMVVELQLVRLANKQPQY